MGFEILKIEHLKVDWNKNQKSMISFKKKMKICETSELFILPYTQYWKLGNRRKFCFALHLASSCNLRLKNDKKWTETKTKRF